MSKYHLHSTSNSLAKCKLRATVSAMNDTTKPALAPPGAGLPKPEQIIGRLLFALRRLTSNRDSLNALFGRERARIHELVEPLEDHEASRRVLIERPPGLEDSSRYWSVWMTLDHLRIVHCEIQRVIGALVAGLVPEGSASTAAVKPGEQVTAAVVRAYERSCDELLATIEGAGDLRTRIRHAHPWFGPLDAAGWQALAASHLRIHRVQIERIRRGLASQCVLAAPPRGSHLCVR